jgi:hypothetical protein
MPTQTVRWVALALDFSLFTLASCSMLLGLSSTQTPSTAVLVGDALRWNYAAVPLFNLLLFLLDLLSALALTLRLWGRRLLEQKLTEQRASLLLY